jgi:tetratricopeptide (TPR) repeat protein
MGAILSQQNKKAEAIAEFDKEIANPETDAATRVNSYINIGLLQRDLGNHEGSIAAFEKVIELDKTQSEAYSYLAEQYLAAGKPAKAEEVQAKARAIAWKRKVVYKRRGDLLERQAVRESRGGFQARGDARSELLAAWKSLGYAL